MFPKEEREALVKTLKDTVMELVPETVVSNYADGEFAFSIARDDRLVPFCLLIVREDHLEMRLPRLHEGKSRLDPLSETRGWRLIIRAREDIPGEPLNAAILSAARGV